MRLRTAPTEGRSGWPATVLPATHGGPARRGLGAPYSAVRSTLVPHIEKFGDPSRFHSGRTPSISCVSRIDGVVLPSRTTEGRSYPPETLDCADDTGSRDT